MTRPITIEQPAGSLLRVCVDRLAIMKLQDTDLHSPDPDVRALAARQFLEDEPRIWMLPTAFVRDVLVRPALVELYGQEAVATLHPDIVAEIAACNQALAKATATATERRAPDNHRKNAALAVSLIVAAWLEVRRPWLSASAVYAATAEVLGPGINAKVIRDTVLGFFQQLVRLSPEVQTARMTGALALRDLLPDVVFELPRRYSLERYTHKRKSARKS